VDYIMTEIVLGSECDDPLFARLVAEVKALGGSITDKQWTLGGSQEMTVFQITLPNVSIEAVAETYVGLSLRGTSSMVEELARRVMSTPSTAAPVSER
jgi:hypothetical protein